MVLMVTGQLSTTSELTLTADGWTVQRVALIHNPGTWTRGDGKKFPARFWGVYSKLALFNLTDYETVVFLDSDALVVRNIDELFHCPGFCAALRHSERFNTGVFTVRPNATVFNNMLDLIGTLPSYTGGDQGFFAEYYPDFADSLLFKGAQEYPNGTQYMRLPTGYNADLGLYVVNNGKWSIPEEQLAVVHYTLGGFKPWDWWTTWVVDEAWRWQSFRDELPADALGVTRGETRAQIVLRWLLVPLPLLLLELLLLPASGCYRWVPTDAKLQKPCLGRELTTQWRQLRCFGRCCWRRHLVCAAAAGAIGALCRPTRR